MKKNSKKKQQQMFQKLLEAEKEKQKKQEEKRLKKKQRHEMNVESTDNSEQKTDQASVLDWNTFNSNNNNNDNMQDDDDDYDMSIELPHKRSSGKADEPPPFSREVKRKKPRKFYAKRLKKEEKKAQMQSD
mmetsp:Transcript_24127/g.33828  ORF Transcript_24127/g.33828 Transcript_24127/m.33828 type:complete len:131 (-) Transcript_24127:55-447(-)